MTTSRIPPLNFPYFFDSSPCSGGGIPLLNVSIPGESVVYEQLCACDSSTRHAASDMFDLHVPGTGLAFSCPNPYVGSFVVWSFMLFFWSVKWLYHIVVLWHHARRRGIKKRYARQSKTMAILSYVPYRVLILDVFFASPLMLTVPIMKLVALSEGRPLAIGSDVSVTVCLGIGFLLATIVPQDFYYQHLYTITMGTYMKSDVVKTILRQFGRNLIASDVAYVALTVIPMYVSLGIDKYNGPMLNNQYVLLIVRCFGIIVYAFLTYVAARMSKRSAERLLASMARSSSAMSTPKASKPNNNNNNNHNSLRIKVGGGEGDSRGTNGGGGGGIIAPDTEDVHLVVRRIVEYTDENYARISQQTKFTTGVYVVALIPYMWPYQEYIIAPMLVILAAINNVGRVLSNAHRARSPVVAMTPPGDVLKSGERGGALRSGAGSREKGVVVASVPGVNTGTSDD